MTPAREFRVSPAGLAGRWIGHLLWLALPLALRPITSVAEENVRRRRGDASRRTLLSLLPWMLAIPAALWSLAAILHFKGVGRDFLRNPAGASIQATAREVHRAGDGVWKILHPAAATHARNLGRLIDAGGEAMRTAESERRSAARAMADLGPVARLQQGKSLTSSARQRLADVRAPWHRETFAFRELSRILEPYGDPPGEIRLQGRVTALPPGRAVQLVPLSAGETPLATPGNPLHPGETFDFAVPLDGRLAVVDLEASGGSGLYRVAAERRFALAEWSERPLPLPSGAGELQVRFGPATTQVAPPLASLSPQASAELDLPPSGTPSGSPSGGND